MLNINIVKKIYEKNIQRLKDILKERKKNRKPLSVFLLGEYSVIINILKDIFKKEKVLFLNGYECFSIKKDVEIVVLKHIEEIVPYFTFFYELLTKNILFIGITEKIDIVDSLEKRLKSRFSQKIILFNPFSEYSKFKNMFFKENNRHLSNIVEENPILEKEFNSNIESFISKIGILFYKEKNIFIEEDSLLTQKLNKRERVILSIISKKQGIDLEKCYKEYKKYLPNCLFQLFLYEINILCEMNHIECILGQYFTVFPTEEVFNSLQKNEGLSLCFQK